MYKSASRFLQSQPVSRFFRDHLHVEDTQDIINRKSVMDWLWDSTKRKGLRYILGGVSDYELVLLYLALFDEDRLDLQGVLLAEGLIQRFSATPVVIDLAQREQLVSEFSRAYDRYRMR